LLLEADVVTGDGDVVIGGIQGDQAEDQTTADLEDTEVIQTGPGALWCW
jgi:hypothetical protein